MRKCAVSAQSLARSNREHNNAPNPQNAQRLQPATHTRSQNWAQQVPRPIKFCVEFCHKLQVSRSVPSLSIHLVTARSSNCLPSQRAHQSSPQFLWAAGAIGSHTRSKVRSMHTKGLIRPLCRTPTPERLQHSLTLVKSWSQASQRLIGTSATWRHALLHSIHGSKLHMPRHLPPQALLPGETSSRPLPLQAVATAPKTEQGAN